MRKTDTKMTRFPTEPRDANPVRPRGAARFPDLAPPEPEAIERTFGERAADLAWQATELARCGIRRLSLALARRMGPTVPTLARAAAPRLK